MRHSLRRMFMKWNSNCGRNLAQFPRTSSWNSASQIRLCRQNRIRKGWSFASKSKTNTLWSRVLQKPIVVQIINNFHAFYVTWKSITAITGARPWFLITQLSPVCCYFQGLVGRILVLYTALPQVFQKAISPTTRETWCSYGDFFWHVTPCRLFRRNVLLPFLGPTNKLCKQTNTQGTE
jgi:hypothetical protein